MVVSGGNDNGPLMTSNVHRHSGRHPGSGLNLSTYLVEYRSVNVIYPHFRANFEYRFYSRKRRTQLAQIRRILMFRLIYDTVRIMLLLTPQ